jgi:hypothetical protein
MLIPHPDTVNYWLGEKTTHDEVDSADTTWALRPRALIKKGWRFTQSLVLEVLNRGVLVRQCGDYASLGRGVLVSSVLIAFVVSLRRFC